MIKAGSSPLYSLSRKVKTNPPIGVVSSLSFRKERDLELFLSDMKRIMSYSKSSQFVNNRVVRTENTRNTDPN